MIRRLRRRPPARGPAAAARPVRVARPALVAAAALLAGAAWPAVAGAAARERPPEVQARSAIVVEARTGEVVYRKTPNRRQPIASTTKLMTALLTREAVALGDRFTAARYSAAPIESKIDLRAGERMTVRDLLRALLLESANDAAVTLAEGVSGSRRAFVRDMNRRAEELGLRRTSFANPIGLDDPGNHSSAADLAVLTRLLLRDRFLSRTVDLEDVRLRSGRRSRRVANRNTLLRREPWVDGVKTGHTNTAGYVLVGSATRRGVSVVSVVLGEPSEAARNADTLALLRFGLGRFRRATLVRDGQVLGRARVAHRDEDAVSLVPARSVRQVIRRGERAQVDFRGPVVLEGPKPAGARVGVATVRVDGEVAARVPVVTAQPVPKVGLPERAWRAVGRPVVLLGVLAVALIASVLLAMRRRRVRTA